MLVFGHLLDLFFFSSRRSPRTQLVWFVIWTLAVIGQFWWFKDLALGVHGPINDHWGLHWRDSWNVSLVVEQEMRVDVTAC